MTVADTHRIHQAHNRFAVEDALRLEESVISWVLLGSVWFFESCTFSGKSLQPCSWIIPEV
jgi:hypothetical protein